MVAADMKTYEWETKYGILQYAIMNDENTDVDTAYRGIFGKEIMLTGYKGKDIDLTIPDELSGLPVTTVGKKTFLGAKNLRSISLPVHLVRIQEWAFASCTNLETVFLPGRKIDAGQGIFKDCMGLQRVVPTAADTSLNAEKAFEPTVMGKQDPDGTVSYLLAAAVNKLDAFYLFDPAAAGSSEWFKQWDARMLTLMGQADEEGFSKMLLCGEEDYGSRENNLDYYVEQRRRFKVRLAMLRLMYDAALPAEIKKELLCYLQAHKKGADSEETWKVVLEEHGDERTYYQFLLDYDCIDRDNFDAVLSDMGDRHTEMKAFLMNCRDKWADESDAFGALEL